MTSFGWLDYLNPVTYLYAIFGPEWFPAFCYSAALFCAGVVWAAYRAIGWVERMHAWARAVELEDNKEAGLAGQKIDSMGVN